MSCFDTRRGGTLPGCPIFVGLFACLFSACSDEGQLTVLVHSDCIIPAELDGILAVIPNRGIEHLFELGQDDLPLSFGVTPEKSDPEEPFEIVIAGRGSLGNHLSTRRLLDRFPEEGHRLLPIFLAKACEKSGCPDEQTCIETGRCRDASVRSGELATIEEGDELSGDRCYFPGKSYCVDLNTMLTCEAFGQAPVQVRCPGLCDAATGQCDDPNKRHPLLVKLDGDGGGIVTGGGISCPDQCDADYPHGTVVELTAEADETSDFRGWSGDCVADGLCTLEMIRAHEVIAHFERRVAQVTVTKNGQGTVTSHPAGIDCGAVCTAPFRLEEVVTLDYAPAGGYILNSWEGCPSGAPVPCELPITQEIHTVTANFGDEAQPNYRLWVRFGDSPGSVQSFPPGIDCTTDCDNTFVAGEWVHLVATPTGADLFNGWGGECDGLRECFVEMSTHRVVDASFAADSDNDQFHVVIEGRGRGHVEFPARDFSCFMEGGLNCWKTLQTGSTVALNAIEMDDSKFLGWFGPCEDNDLSCVFTLNQFERIWALFEPIRYDMNGDKKDDLILGAPGDSRLLLFNGDTFPAPPTDPSGASCTITGAANTRLGESFSTAEDMTGNERADLVVAEPSAPGGGAVHILERRQGQALCHDEVAISDLQKVTINALSGSMGFGAKVSAIEDLGVDGRPDLLIAAGGTEQLLVYSSTDWSATLTLSAEHTGDALGEQIAVGDFDGDFHPDFAVAAPKYINVPSKNNYNRGRVYVFAGSSFHSGSHSAANADVIFQGEANDFMGTAIAGIRDFNADGFDDLAIGDALGTVKVFPGGHPFVESTPIFTYSATGRVTLTGGFDMTGDGFPDLIVGTPEENTVRIFAGGPTPSQLPFHTITGDCDCATAEQFGITVGPAGDLNGDGRMDLAVGSQWQTTPSVSGGVSIFYSGSVSSASSGAQVQVHGSTTSSDYLQVIGPSW